MKRAPLVLIFILSAALVHAQQATPTPPSTTSTPTPLKPAQSLRGKLIYKPVGPGVPSGRVDAGSRGDGDEVASLYVMTPENVGLSARAQPSLYWFQTAPAHLPFEISILQPNHPTPVLRVRQSEPTTSGFHHLDLAEHGVHLAPGVDYQWIVALIRDPQSRSRDIVSSGWIRYEAKTAASEPRSNAASYAAAGLWYDAVSALFAQIDAHPRDPQLAADRRDLLTQVGLPPLPATKRQP
jgi:hypothetical protein